MADSEISLGRSGIKGIPDKSFSAWLGSCAFAASPFVSCYATCEGVRALLLWPLVTVLSLFILLTSYRLFLRTRRFVLFLRPFRSDWFMKGIVGLLRRHTRGLAYVVTLAHDKTARSDYDFGPARYPLFGRGGIAPENGAMWLTLIAGATWLLVAMLLPTQSSENHRNGLECYDCVSIGAGVQRFRSASEAKAGIKRADQAGMSDERRWEIEAAAWSLLEVVAGVFVFKSIQERVFRILGWTNTVSTGAVVRGGVPFSSGDVVVVSEWWTKDDGDGKNWKAAVSLLAEKCACILVDPADISAGLEWELREVVERHWAKTVVLREASLSEHQLRRNFSERLVSRMLRGGSRGSAYSGLRWEIAQAMSGQSSAMGAKASGRPGVDPPVGQD